MAWPTTDIELICDRTGTEHRLSIGLPVRQGSLERAPLLLTLDGPWMFGTVMDATRIMSMSGEAPEAVVVGLSFAAASMGEYLRERARWFTPTPWVPPEVTGVKGLRAEECGRAAELLGFIEDQAMPEVERRLPDHLQLSDRWLIGHSFSALFGLTALFGGCDSFDRWLLASPSIWWDDRSVLNLEMNHNRTGSDLDADLFVCYGQDEFDPDEHYFRMGRNVEELVATLADRAYPGLTVKHQEIAATGHASSIGGAVSAGLRALR